MFLLFVCLGQGYVVNSNYIQPAVPSAPTPFQSLGGGAAPSYTPYGAQPTAQTPVIPQPLATLPTTTATTPTPGVPVSSTVVDLTRPSTPVALNADGSVYVPPSTANYDVNVKYSSLGRPLTVVKTDPLPRAWDSDQKRMNEDYYNSFGLHPDWSVDEKVHEEARNVTAAAEQASYDFNARFENAPWRELVEADDKDLKQYPEVPFGMAKGM